MKRFILIQPSWFALSLMLFGVVATSTVINYLMLDRPSVSLLSNSSIQLFDVGQRTLASMSPDMNLGGNINSEMNELELSSTTARISRQEKLMDQLAIGLLRGRYRLELDPKNGRIRSLRLFDSNNFHDETNLGRHYQTGQIGDRQAFLKFHEPLWSSGFTRSQLVSRRSHDSAITEVYQLFEKTQPSAEVEFNLDLQGRLLSMVIRSSS